MKEDTTCLIRIEKKDRKILKTIAVFNDITLKKLIHNIAISYREKMEERINK